MCGGKCPAAAAAADFGCLHSHRKHSYVHVVVPVRRADCIVITKSMAFARGKVFAVFP